MTGDQPAGRQPKLVVDSSVVMKWYLNEPGSDHAVALRDSGAWLIGPDLLVLGVGNILWKRVQRDELTAREAAHIASVYEATAPVEVVATSPLLQVALDLAITYGRTVYDSVYIALALTEQCVFITADERLVNALATTPLAGQVRLLGSYVSEATG